MTYQIVDTIRLRPGRYQLRVSAMSAKLVTGGSVYLDLDVPDFTEERLTIGGLALGYAAGPRVPTTTGSPGSPRNASRAVAPRSVLPFPPTLDRTFVTSDTLRVYFEVASREGMAGLTGTLAILGAHGAPVHASLPFVPDKDGRVELAVPLEGLERGPYIVRAMVTGGENSATREIGFLIR